MRSPYLAVVRFMDHLMKGLSDYDGCLLLGDDPDLVEFAGLFEAMGKEVWRQLADIPASKPA